VGLEVDAISERTGSSEAAHSRAGSPRRCDYRRKGIGTKGRKDHEETMFVEGEVSVWQSRVGYQKIGP
jgi:hypothetical protein